MTRSGDSPGKKPLSGMELIVALEAGAGLLAQDGAEEDGHEETGAENADDHQPLVVREEHVQPDPE